LIVKFMLCLLFCDFHPSQQKGKITKIQRHKYFEIKADITFHDEKKYYIDASRCSVALARMQRLTRHEQNGAYFGRDLVKSGMQGKGQKGLGEE